jgi:manganese/zinc/iron transport system substrate-binding protein
MIIIRKKEVPMSRAPSVALALALAVMPPTQAAAQPRVLASVGMIADPMARIAGDCAQVSALMGPDTDPHLFQPRPSDIRALQQADVVLAVGLGLEGRLGDLLARLGAQRSVVLLGETLPPETLLDADGAPDPHLWMDPALWALTFPAMAATLPDCPGIAERLAAEIARAQALDDWARASLASIPAPVLVTGHDAFAYLARAYGLENLAVQGISTAAEVSVAEIDALARDVAARAVPAVFVEATLSPRSIRALIEATQARGHALALGGELLTDALAQPGQPGATWPGMIVHNVTAITQALGGTVAVLPEGTMP